jgi:hypothetical protein
MSAGRNVPRFIDAQLEFAAHIRNPDLHPGPVDVDPRRMQVYVDLFHRNIEGFLARGFPVAKQTLEGVTWSALVRRFIHVHASHSPYFLDIAQEFMTFLDAGDCDVAVPDWLLELCHYEWVEMALGVDPREIAFEAVDPQGDPFEAPAALNPLLWSLAYRYPVHQIGPDHRPTVALDAPCHLVVYRDSGDRVRFLESSAATHRLIGLLDGTRSGREAAGLIAVEMGRAAAPIEAAVRATLTRLRASEVVLGTHR